MVFEGKLDRVTVKHEGKTWFNDRMLTNKVHLKPGDSISQKQLIQDVGRMNLNPQFRQVEVVYEPGEWDPSGHGTTTVDLEVKERFPFRAFAGADDYGLKILGEDQVFGGFNYGNVFGVDQQLNYQYTADFSFDKLQQHTASYVIPLPWWGNSLTIFGNYNRVKPDLTEIGLPANTITYNNGRTYQASLRYTVPLPGWFGLNQSIAAGYDYKNANTPAQFGKTVLSPYRADVDQAVLEYHGFLPDRIGFTQLSASGYYSPGGLLGKNTDQDFGSFNPGLKSSYYYGKAELIRDFTLPLGLHLRGRGGLQDASTGLLPSEELYLGGNALLRGYPESVVSGDEGWYGSVELHSPLIRTGNLTRQRFIPNVDGDILDVFGFFDYGSVRPENPNPGSSVTLDSVGGGLVYTLSQYLKINFAYGYQLKSLPSGTPPPLTKDKSRFHLAGTVSF